MTGVSATVPAVGNPVSFSKPNVKPIPRPVVVATVCAPINVPDAATFLSYSLSEIVVVLFACVGDSSVYDPAVAGQAVSDLVEPTPTTTWLVIPVVSVGRVMVVVFVAVGPAAAASMTQVADGQPVFATDVSTPR